jgi:hypothetical protein
VEAGPPPETATEEFAELKRLADQRKTGTGAQVFGATSPGPPMSNVGLACVEPGIDGASREATSAEGNELTRCWAEEHNREEAHRTSALTGSIPVSRTSKTAAQSIFFGTD